MKILCAECARTLALLNKYEIHVGPKLCVDCLPQPDENVTPLKGKIVDPTGDDE